MAQPPDHIGPMFVERIAKRLRTRVKTAQLDWRGSHEFGDRLMVHCWRMGNGLRVQALRDPSAPVVSFQSWFAVGSKDEQPRQTGLAHFFEHLMFCGTQRFGPGVFDRKLEAIGGQVNAATWTDWTHYYDNVPAGELGPVIELEADRLTGISLDVETVEAERQVVASERRDRIDDDVDGKANEVLWFASLGKHPYGHPTLGWMDDILAYRLADIRKFYRKWYAPNNLTITVCGDFDELQLLESIQASYGRIKPSRLPPRIAATRRTRSRQKVIALPCATSRVMWSFDAPGVGSRDWQALAVFCDILFNGRTSRLYRELVLERELVTQVWSDLPPFVLSSLWEAGFVMREGKSQKQAEKVVRRELERATQELVTGRELEIAKNRIELSLLSQLESAAGKAEQMGFSQATMSNPAVVWSRLATYRALTAQDILKVARRYGQARFRLNVNPASRRAGGS